MSTSTRIVVPHYLSQGHEQRRLSKAAVNVCGCILVNICLSHKHVSETEAHSHGKAPLLKNTKVGHRMQPLLRACFEQDENFQRHRDRGKRGKAGDGGIPEREKVVLFTCWQQDLDKISCGFRARRSNLKDSTYFRPWSSCLHTKSPGGNKLPRKRSTHSVRYRHESRTRTEAHTSRSTQMMSPCLL